MEMHDLTSESSSGSTKIDGASCQGKFKASADIDYGIIIRTQNPFNRRNGLIIFAGAQRWARGGE
jgi:hypothetical protein